MNSTVEQLEKELQFYKIMVDNSYGWEYWADEDYNVLYSSNSCERVTGYTADEFLQKKGLIIDIIHHDDKDYFINHKHLIDGEGHREPIDFRIIHKNGEIVWINHSCSYIEDSASGFTGTRASNRVITHEKNIEKELSNSKLELQHIFDSSPSMMLLLNEKTEIIKVNNTALVFANATEEDIINRRGGDAFHCIYSIESPQGCGYGDSCKVCVLRNTVLDTFKSEKSHYNVEFQMVVGNSTDQEIFTILLSSILTSGYPNKKVLIMLDDITTRKRIETEQKESEERYRELSELTFEEIIIHRDGIITEVNRSFCKIFSITESEIRGQNILDYIFIEDRDWVKKHYLEKFEKPYEARIVDTEGEVIPVELEARENNINGKMIRVVAIRDLRQRKKIANELKLLSEIVKQSPSGIITTDINGAILFANTSYLAMTDDSAENVLGKKSLFFDREKVGEVKYKEMWESINRNGTWKGELINRKITGEEYYEQNTISSIVNSDSIVEGYFSIKNDITNEKLVENELKEAEERYRVITSHVSEGISVLDENKNYVFVNPSFCNIVGYSENELLKMNVKEIWVDKRNCDKNCEILENKGSFQQSRTHLRRKDDLVITAEVTGKQVQYNNKNLTLVVIKDITEREKLLKAVYQSEERFHEIFQNMSDGCVIYRWIEDQKDFFIENVNRSSERIEDIPKSQMIGRYITELFPGVKDFGLYDIMLNVLKTGESQQFPLTFYNDNRLSGWRDNFVYKLSNNNIVCIYADKTKEKEDEIKLVEKNSELTQALALLEKNESLLKEVNATKDRFFSIIAHDLRSPFTAILGYLEILLKRSSDFDDAQRNKLLKGALDTSKNTFNLLENLLQWAQSQSGVIQFNPEGIEFQEMVLEAISVLNEFALSKEIELSSTIDTPFIVSCDREMIKTVLRNFISNAIKFTPRGGKITISAEETPKNLIILVKDSGLGMSSETIGKLFDVTAKVSTTGTENERGTGLGLFLCKEFIDKHNGKINVMSELGVGSQFSFTIPK